MRILFCGGLSAGHLSPLLAVQEEILKRGDVECFFICSKRESDAAFLRSQNVSFAQVTHPQRSFGCLWQLFKGMHEATSVMRQFQPDIVFSKGGAVSVPVCLVAWWKRIPIVLHESDSIMGLSNRFISRFAAKVCLGFPKIVNFPLSIVNSVATGNPIRSFITKGSREEGLRITGFSGTRPILLVMGGSQGAQSVNDVIIKKLDTLLKICDVIHLTGEGKERGVWKQGYYPLAFAREELPHLYACTTLAVSRAGAGGISELAAWSIPTILIPLEGVAQNHQTRNADVLAQQHACVLLLQQDLEAKLVHHVERLLGDTAEQKRLGGTLHTLLVPDAARLVSDILFKVISAPDRNG